MTIERVGIWLDRDWARAQRDGLLTTLLEIPAISEWCVMLGGASSRDLDDKWSDRDLGKLADLTAQHDISLVGTVWIRPTRDSLRQLQELGLLLVDLGFAALELEAEGNWKRSRVSGYADLDEAGRALQDVCDAIQAYAVRKGRKIRVQATIHLGRLNTTITSWSESDTVQAYSKDTPEDEDDDWGGEIGPAWRQVLGYQRLTEIHAPHLPKIHDELYDKDIDPLTVPGLVTRFMAKHNLPPASTWGGLGLPLWLQGPYPGDESVAMQLAWDTAEALGCEFVRYWSSKWVLYNDDYALPFLMTLPVDRAENEVVDPIDWEPGERTWRAWVDAQMAHDQLCPPLPPWRFLSEAERAAWAALEAT